MLDLDKTSFKAVHKQYLPENSIRLYINQEFMQGMLVIKIIRVMTEKRHLSVITLGILKSVQ